MNTLKTIAFATVLLASTSAFAAPESYTIDTSHANITFSLSHFGFSSPNGKFPGAEGKLVIDQEKPENSKVDVKIPVSELITGVPKLDEHLKKPDFFDVEKFPLATFTSTKVDVTGKDTAKVTGDLTLHGVTKPVTLDVKLNKLAENMFKKQTAGFSGTTTIKRSEFGITTYVPDLGDDVHLTIELEANLDTPPAN